MSLQTSQRTYTAALMDWLCAPWINSNPSNGLTGAWAYRQERENKGHRTTVAEILKLAEQDEAWTFAAYAAEGFILADVDSTQEQTGDEILQRMDQALGILGCTMEHWPSGRPGNYGAVIHHAHASAPREAICEVINGCGATAKAQGQPVRLPETTTKNGARITLHPEHRQALLMFGIHPISDKPRKAQGPTRSEDLARSILTMIHNRRGPTQAWELILIGQWPGWEKAKEKGKDWFVREFARNLKAAQPTRMKIGPDGASHAPTTESLERDHDAYLATIRQTWSGKSRLVSRALVLEALRDVFTKRAAGTKNPSWAWIKVSYRQLHLDTQLSMKAVENAIRDLVRDGVILKRTPGTPGRLCAEKTEYQLLPWGAHKGDTMTILKKSKECAHTKCPPGDHPKEVIHNAFQRIPSMARLFMAVAKSRRPMSRRELAEALSDKPGSSTLRRNLRDGVRGGLFLEDSGSHKTYRLNPDLDWGAWERYRRREKQQTYIKPLWSDIRRARVNVARADFESLCQAKQVPLPRDEREAKAKPFPVEISETPSLKTFPGVPLVGTNSDDASDIEDALGSLSISLHGPPLMARPMDVSQGVRLL
jgi:hypothetical protein